jgi:hypothetical protein
MTKTRAEEGSVPVTITDDDRSLLEQAIEDNYTPVRKLLSENAALTAEVARLQTRYESAEQNVRWLREELRLHTDEVLWNQHKLATANALLGEWLQHHGSDPRGPGPATMAHLAGLPTTAAPARAAAEQRVLAAAAAWAGRCSGQAIIDCWDPIDRELYLAVKAVVK